MNEKFDDLSFDAGKLNFQLICKKTFARNLNKL